MWVNCGGSAVGPGKLLRRNAKRRTTRGHGDRSNIYLSLLLDTNNAGECALLFGAGAARDGACRAGPDPEVAGQPSVLLYAAGTHRSFQI